MPRGSPQIYTLGEALSSLLYIGLGIFFLVLAGQTFAGERKLSTSTASDEYVEKVAQYKEKELPSIAKWTATTSSPQITNPFTMHSEEFKPHRNAPAAVTTRYLRTNTTFAKLSGAGGIVTGVTIQTDLNTVTVTNLNLNFTSTETANSSCLFDSDGFTCNGTKSCVTAFGESSTPKAVLNSENKVICNLPMMSTANCILLTRRRNDTGADVWWPSFDLKGCKYPFDAYHSVRRLSNTIFIEIRTVDDPVILNELLSQGGRKSLKFEVKDSVPTAVGVLLCALLLLPGGLYMAAMISVQVHEFWSRDERHPMMNALCGSSDEASGTAASTTTTQMNHEMTTLKK